jgi:formylglycine-generating enzyme required for sulfatase activity
LAPPIKNQTKSQKGEGKSILDGDKSGWNPPKIKLVKSAREGKPLSFFNSLDFVDIQPGLFSMGADEEDAKGQEYEKPLHGVVLSGGFRLAKYQVSQDLFERFMGYNPSLFKGNLRPVENVTFYEALDFIARLNALGNRVYRLPTEAEWEYSARADRKGPYYFGATPEDLTLHAWFAYNSGGRSQNVGLKDPNPWGLYDMLGNVWEWVGDWYGDYDSSTCVDPTGPSEGTEKVIRGGAWGSSPWLCRVTTRSVKAPDDRSPLVGFRLALNGTSTSEMKDKPEDDDL